MSEKQGSLFGQSNHDGQTTFKVARDSDPVTSHQAAAKVELTGRRKLFYETLKTWAGIPRTAQEIAEYAIPFTEGESVRTILSRRDTLRKRAKELVKSGLVRECEARECRVTGNNATTYEVIR